jgi:hypothetical protein
MRLKPNRRLDQVQGLSLKEVSSITPSDPARSEGGSDDEGEPDLDLTIAKLPHQAKSLNPVTVDPGDEIVIVNTSQLGDTELAHAFLGQKGTVIRRGIRSCYIELDRGLRVWIGHNRIALTKDADDTPSIDELRRDESKVRSEDEEQPPKDSRLAHGYDPIPPRVKDSNVVSHTKEERFIRIQLSNLQCVPLGSC